MSSDYEDPLSATPPEVKKKKKASQPQEEELSLPRLVTTLGYLSLGMGYLYIVISGERNIRRETEGKVSTCC